MVGVGDVFNPISDPKIASMNNGLSMQTPLVFIQTAGKSDLLPKSDSSDTLSARVIRQDLHGQLW